MFGGYGVYRDDLMFALVADDVLYLKADKRSVEGFESKGLGRFEYEKKGKTVALSYYEAPEEIYDNPEDAKLWARRAYDAALRAKASGRKNAGNRE